MAQEPLGGTYKPGIGRCAHFANRGPDNGNPRMSAESKRQTEPITWPWIIVRTNAATAVEEYYMEGVWGRDQKFAKRLDGLVNATMLVDKF